MKYIEMHLLQNVPVNNLNRGEDGEIKTMYFGGVERQRISSQAWKRPIRLAITQYCKDQKLNFGIFSRKYMNEIKNELEKEGIIFENDDKFNELFNDFSIKIKLKNKKTDKDVILYLSNEELKFIKEEFKNYHTNPKDFKFSKEKTKKLEDISGRNPYDIATFGRMCTNIDSFNTSSALHINHAFSVNVCNKDQDYFTAVDDLAKFGDGASQLGSNCFATSVFYRYICLDLNQLLINLKMNSNDPEYKEYLKVLLKTCLLAFPTGKENAMNARTKPAYIIFNVNDSGCPSQYCNAFDTPIDGNSKQGILKTAIDKLRTYYQHESAAWGKLKYTGEWEENTTNISIDTIINEIIAEC